MRGENQGLQFACVVTCCQEALDQLFIGLLVNTMYSFWELARNYSKCPQWEASVCNNSVSFVVHTHTTTSSTPDVMCAYPPVLPVSVPWIRLFAGAIGSFYSLSKQTPGADFESFPGGTRCRFHAVTRGCCHGNQRWLSAANINGM